MDLMSNKTKLYSKIQTKYKHFIKNPDIKNRIIRVFINLITEILKFKYKSLVIRRKTSDFYVFREIFTMKEFDIDIDTPKIIIDCGAYAGYSTYYFAMKYPESKIIAIEPETSNYELLKENTKNFENVITINKAVYYKESKIKIVETDEGKWACQIKEDDEGIIESTSIDQLISEFNLDKIDLLKMDIEGTEKIIFDHSDNWIDKVSCIIIELHDRYVNGCSTSFYNAIKKYNFIIDVQGEKVIARRQN